MMAAPVCPFCGARGLPLPQGAKDSVCSRCGAVVPEAVGDASGGVSEGRPPLLMFLMIFLAFFAFFGALITLITLAMPGNDDYLVDNDVATKGEFLMKMLPSTLRFLFAGPIAYGLWKERRWARPLLLAFVGLSEFGKFFLPGWKEAPAGVIVPRLILSGILFGLLSWYLYGKRNVVRYYRARSDPPSHPSTQHP